jgi:quercetin dioxygenase-like cupin family protein
MSTPDDHPNGGTHTLSMANVKHLPANRGRAFAFPLNGSTVSFKAEPDDNDDALFLFEVRLLPTFSVPAHTERTYEAFYVLEGTLELEADGERYRLGPNDFVSIRPGIVHALHNPGPGMMRILSLVSPGSQHARFFSTLGKPIDDPSNPPQPSGPPDFKDFERLAAVGRECGIEFLPPPEPNDGEQA